MQDLPKNLAMLFIAPKMKSTHCDHNLLTEQQNVQHDILLEFTESPTDCLRSKAGYSIMKAQEEVSILLQEKISNGVAKIKHALENSKEIPVLQLGNLDAKRDWTDAEDLWKVCG